MGMLFSLVLSITFGICNAASIQLRCISLLTFPMYCGKPGRGVLKAVVLTYVIAGPITNMGLNAQEVVRVFACTTELAYNLSRTKYWLIANPLRDSLFRMSNDIEEMKDTLRSIEHVVTPIEKEIEGSEEIVISMAQNDYFDDYFEETHRSEEIEAKYRYKRNDEDKDVYQQKYLKKLEVRCQNEISRAIASCLEVFTAVYNSCREEFPSIAGWSVCFPMRLTNVCNIKDLIGNKDVCDSNKEVDPGLGEGYAYLKNAKKKLTHLDDIKLQYKITYQHELYDIQSAKETGDLVMHDFEEKNIMMRMAIDILNICMALLFLRIFVAAVTYHDMYLTDIEYDNVYITSYFKRIDIRRKMKNKYYLLPLKKMERIKYVDVHSIAYVKTDRDMLVMHILKVMLEVVTATTFIMLDRLFFEALDVVRQHAITETSEHGAQDLEITVEGTGVLARIVRKIVDRLKETNSSSRPVASQPCLPCPKLMPPSYFFKIYGGYLWIVILLYLNPFTLRLRSYFYARREKQRILHLYNDILKKRMKMHKTLQRKAIQAVRAHYLSGENLLSIRMKFPRLMGWLSVVPTARMTCLICGDTEPRLNEQTHNTIETWQSCAVPKCPFKYCIECWREVGAKCLACDPHLLELSDIDSYTEDEQPK